MRTSVPRRLGLGLAWMLGVTVAGCDTALPSNLSPTPDQATDRHEQAIRYSEQRARTNREAERKAMDRKHLTPLSK
jgi:hypothetical protein